MGPATGTVSFQATADDFFRFTVDASTIMDTVSSEGGPSSSILTGETDMKKVNVVVFFRQDDLNFSNGGIIDVFVAQFSLQ